MKGNAKKILFLEIIFILFASLCIIFGIKINEYLLSLILFAGFGASIYLIGFKKDKIAKNKKIIITVAVITIAILFLTYAIGFIGGFVRSPYTKNIFGMLMNIIPVVLIIVPMELLRYQFCSEKNLINIILSVVVLVLIDIMYSMSFYDFVDNFVLLEFVCLIVIPSISKNVVMSIYSKNYGYAVTLVYTLILGIYEYIVPITPNYDEYLTSIMNILMPLFNMQFINFYFRKRERKDSRDKHIGSKIFITLCVLFLIFLVCIYSNLFRYWVATIASGSMSPTIEVGDIVVIDKWYADNPSELVVGDVLVFKVKNTLYTHRIISILEKNNNYYIRTKGDYKDNAEDSWVVVKDDIVGRVEYKIKYLGLPSVWLHNLLSKGA